MQRARVPIVLWFLTLIVLAEFCLGDVHKGKTVAVKSPLKDEHKIHVLFSFDTPETGIFPSDIFTVVDNFQKTGLRVNLPLPDCKVRVSDSPGGMNSRFDLLRMRPAARQETGEALAARVPSLLNSPGITSWGGIPVSAPFFNENIPLRNLPIVINQVAGAMDIQRYFDEIAWISASGDGASYAPNIRKEPLAGISPRPFSLTLGKGTYRPRIRGPRSCFARGDMQIW